MKLEKKLGKRPSYSLIDISYVTKLPIKEIKKRYEKGLKKIKIITMLFDELDNLPSEANFNIVNKSNMEILLHNIRNRFPVFNLLEANIYLSDKVLLWLLTQDYKKVSLLFKINIKEYQEILKLVRRT